MNRHVVTAFLISDFCFLAKSVSIDTIIILSNPLNTETKVTDEPNFPVVNCTHLVESEKLSEQIWSHDCQICFTVHLLGLNTHCLKI